MTRPHDLVITGIPRSGTTLVCALLNELPDTVALLEPILMAPIVAARPAERAGLVEAFFDEQRRSLLAGGTALTKHLGGEVPDNPFEQRADGDASRRRPVLVREHLRFDKPLTPDLTLCVKHPAGFVAMLPDLMSVFECVAVVRNPLSVLGSWNSVDVGVARGRVPVAERLDPTLAAELDAQVDTGARQVHLIGWLFERLRALPRERVLRYEDVVTTGGRALSVVVPAAATLDRELSSRNSSREYDHELMRSLGAALLANDDAPWFDFYERADIERVIDES